VWSFTTAAASGGATLPTPWVDTDIGAVGVAGSASYNAGTFSVSGSGADIWGTADAFHFVYQSLTGDGQLVARVPSIGGVNAWSKAGVMIRETLTAGSAYAQMLVSAAKGTAFQYRTAAAASALNVTGSTAAPPLWIKIVRSGNTISGYQSPDGLAWQQIGTATFTMASAVYIGLAVVSHDNTQLCTATFDNVAVVGGSAPAPAAPGSPSPASGATGVGTTPTLTWSSGAVSYDVSFGTTNPPPAVSMGQSAASYTPPKLVSGTQYFWQVVAHNSAGTTSGPVWSFTTAAAVPSPWQDLDIGAVGVAGSASYANSTFTVSGSGADIWNSADAFHFVYQPMTGDGQVIARVATVQDVNAWSKAGVMIRDTLDPGSAFAIMLVSAAKGTALQYRASAGASAASITGTSRTAPSWLKLVRSGSTIAGYQSADGSTWTEIGSVTITMGSTVEIGLAVTSHDNTRLATATFDHVTP
jgi:regulation of enolase protein 1 (concanavalin A-like superfamily)